MRGRGTGVHPNDHQLGDGVPLNWIYPCRPMRSTPPAAKPLKAGAPGGIRTPDPQIRNLNTPSNNIYGFNELLERFFSSNGIAMARRDFGRFFTLAWTSAPLSIYPFKIIKGMYRPHCPHRPHTMEALTGTMR